MAELEKEVMIDGRPVKFRASAATLRVYRKMYGRDLLADFNSLSEDVEQNGAPDGNTASNISVASLEIFEDLAYCMAKQADPDIPDIDDWLDSFAVFSIYEVLPDIMELWQNNMATLENPKKKADPRPAK